MRKFFLIFFILYFILSFQIPFFVSDEGYYSISITEAINKGIKPYILFFEKPSFWKPPLMVNIYALISSPLINIFNMDIVVAYRFCSVIFTLLNVILVYLISKKFLNKEEAKWVTIIFALNPIILLYGTKIFMETISLFFVLVGVFGCIKYKEQNKKLWLGLIPISIFGAAYSKSFLIGIMSGLLCGLYFFLFNFNKIKKYIVVTIIGVGVCILFAYLSGFPEVYYDLFMEDFFTTRMKTYYIETFISTIIGVIYLLPIFIFGWKKIDLRDRKNLFMIIWFIPLIPIALKSPFIWYGFYFIFPLAYLTIKCIDVKSFDLIVLICLICASFITTYYCLEEHINIGEENNQIIKYLDENISKEDCVIIMGAPEMSIYSYLYHNEYNFNFVLCGGFDYKSENKKSIHYIPIEDIEKYVDDYLYNYDNCIEEKKYLYLSTTKSNYLRSCNKKCSKIDYILISAYPEMDIEGCNKIKDFENVVLWKCGNTN